MFNFYEHEYMTSISFKLFKMSVSHDGIGDLA